MVTIYNLSYYPAAVSIQGNDAFKALDDPSDQIALFVMYEYGDQEPDVECDPNDITWCHIYVQRSNGDIHEVFDDETC